LVFNSLNNRAKVGLIIFTFCFSCFYFKIDKLFFLIISLVSLLEILKLNINNNLYTIILAFLFATITYTINNSNFLIFSLPLLMLISLIISIYFNRLLEISFLIFFLSFLSMFFLILNIDRNLFYLIIFLSFFNDTNAYLFGNLIKGPKIIPSISPNKTWSGTFSSFIFTIFLMIFLNFDILSSIIVSILFFFGDLFFSFIKRKLSVKDFSNFLTDHGGFIDRLDSMVFVTFYFYMYLNYV